MWGILKDKVYNNNSHTEGNLKESIQDAMSSVSQPHLSHAITCCLDVTNICKLKESISSTFFKYGE
jgi:hypothetical protein